MGLVVRCDDVPDRRLLGQIEIVTQAAKPSDVAVGRIVGQKTQAMFRFNPSKHYHPPKDVQATGYPNSAVSNDLDQWRPDVRFLKGSIVRRVPAGNFLMQSHAATFELSFAIPRGISGGPLYVVRGRAFEVIGVCTGNHKSELTDFEHTEIDEVGQSKFREKKVRVEQYGLAEELRELAQWAPESLGGQVLAEAFRPTLQR